MPEQQPIPAGDFVGEYKIIEHLGTGGFGITYRVADRSLDVEFALKEYFPWEFAVRSGQGEVRASSSQQDQFRWGLEKFKAEGQTLAALSLKHDASPYIVKVFRLFEARGTAYILQEFVDGVPLLPHVSGATTPKDIENLFFQLCDGLSYVHQRGICHLDVKPDNILIAKDTQRPKLIDFGSAKRQDTGRTVALITPAFSAVEQYSADAEHGPYTDIYALASTFYSALTGGNPPDAPTRVLDDKCLKMRDQAGFSSFSNKFLNCIDAGMRVLPSERPDSVQEWLRLAETESFSQPSQNVPVEEPLPKKKIQNAVEKQEQVAAPPKKSMWDQEPPAGKPENIEQRPYRALRLALLGVTIFVGLITIYASQGPLPDSNSRPVAQSVPKPSPPKTKSTPISAAGKRTFALRVSPTKWSEFKLHDRARSAGFLEYTVVVGSEGRFIGKASDRFIAMSESGPNYGTPPKSLQFKSLEDSDIEVLITIEER